MKKILLTKGEYAMIDDADFDRLTQLNWHVSKCGYILYAKNNKIGYMHRFIMKPPPERQVDHINGDGLDNRRINLRVVTKSENQRHRIRLSRHNTSGINGVSWDKNRRKWHAYKTLNNRKINLGRFSTKEEAANALLATNPTAVKYGA